MSNVTPTDEDLQKIRQRILDRKGTIQRDPTRFEFSKAQDGERLTFRFRVLPPMDSMGGLWYYAHGYHFLDKKRFECPRIHDNSECPICTLGFEMMKDESKERRSQIAKAYLSRKYYACNIYFPVYKETPEPLRGKVMWASFPQTLYDKCEQCLFRDDPGDEVDPQAYGNFYGIKNGYVLQVVITPKGSGSSRFNNYEESKFLYQTRGPLQKEEAKIVEILSKRHEIPTKFQARDMATLQAQVDRILHKSGSDHDEEGFDEDRSTKAEVKTTVAVPAPIPAPKPAPAPEPAEEFEEMPPDPKASAKPAAKPSKKEEPVAEESGPEPASGGKTGSGEIDDAELQRLLTEIRKKG